MTSIARSCTMSFIFCMLLLAGGGHYGYAFFHESDETQLSSFQMERIRGVSPETPGVLAVSDNYSYLLEKHSQRPVIHRSSERFAAMDLLEINLPMNIALYRPDSLDSNLSDIFYADLKLRKLREEYKILQGRALDLLEEAGLSAAGLAFDPGGVQYGEQPSILPSISIPDGAFDLSRDQPSEQLAISGFVLAPGGSQQCDQPPKQSSISSAHNKLMRERASITKAPGLSSLSDVDSTKLLVTGTPETGLAIGSSKETEPDFHTVGSELASDIEVEAGHMTRGHSITYSHKETLFDKLIDKLFKIPSYILSHKLEAFLLLLSLVVLLKLVSLGRP